MDFPDSSMGKESSCNAGDMISERGGGEGEIPGGKGQPTVVFLLE